MRRPSHWPAVAIVACLLALVRVACAGNGGAVNLDVTADKSTYAAGEALEFTVTAENRGTQPVTLSFRTAQRFDVRIQDPAGREVWRWSADRMFAQALGEERLEPGARRSWNVVVRAPLPAGSYQVVASLQSVNLEVSSSIGITVR